MTRAIILLGFLYPIFLMGQNPYKLSFISQEKDPFRPKKEIFLSSKEEVFEFVDKLRSKHIKKGFILASIDSIKFQDSMAVIKYFRGQLFDKLNITFDQKDAYIIQKVPRVNERLLRKHPFKPKLVEELLSGVSKHLNNNGYPFSKVYLSMDTIASEESFAHLNIEKGPNVKITKVSVKGDPKVQKKFVTNAISIKKGDVYNAELLMNISNKISQIQFLKEIRKHEILFTPEGAEVFLYLESVPVSLINGIVGLQPSPVTEKTIVTGDVKLKLLNVVKRGEELNINWKSLQPKTQELNIGFSFPFLFNTPFGIDTKFDLYKQDSTFLTTNVNLGVRYFLNGGSYIKLFYQADNSNLLSGASAIPNSNLSSLSNNTYGIGLYRNNVDFLPNPSKGFRLDFDISAGRRKSRPSESDSSIVSTTFKGNLNLELFIPLARRHVIRLANKTQSYYAPKIYQNEVFRFGGLTTQRGFNENILFATTLSTFTLEYRFLVDRVSHAFAFFDQSFYENNSRDYTSDQPFGFGAGFSFGTNLGVFSISYALGKQFDNPIELKNGKVHFGYVTYF